MQVHNSTLKTTHSDIVRSCFFCPECAGGLLTSQEGTVVCSGCRRSFAVHQGVYDFMPDHPEPAKELVEQLRGLTTEEAHSVVEMRSLADRGFLDVRGSIALGLAGLVLLLAAVVSADQRWEFALLTVGCVSLADYIAYKSRRSRTLSSTEDIPLVLGSLADWEATSAVPDKFRSMADTKACGAAEDDAAAEAGADARYRQCARVVNALHHRREPPVIVDVGAGDGYFAQFITGEHVYIPLDIIPSLLESASRNVPNSIPVRSPGNRTPLRDGSVDVVVCTESLEHFPDPLSGLCEFERMLAPGGSIILSFPNAHRIRNLNLFHILIDLTLGRIFPAVTQPVVLHQNMWWNARTYHYDFTADMLHGMLQSTDLEVVKTTTIGYLGIARIARGRHRFMEAAEGVLQRIPGLSHGGRSWLVILRKPN